MAFLERNLEQLTNVQKQVRWKGDWRSFEEPMLTILSRLAGWTKLSAQKGSCHIGTQIGRSKWTHSKPGTDATRGSRQLDHPNPKVSEKDSDKIVSIAWPLLCL
jgi:hypothetical protein